MKSSCVSGSNNFVVSKYVTLMLAATLWGSVALIPDLSLADDGEPTVIDVKGATWSDEQTLATYATPIDQLEYSPLVDVETRGFAQAQSDVSIRGSTFDQTGVLLGAVPLFDPQTGHYSFEIPLPSHIFAPAEILTGTELSERLAIGAGGAVAYTLRPIADGGFARAGIGDFRLNTQEISEARKIADTEYGTLASELSFGHSSSNGSLANSGHEFYRYFGRVGLTADNRDTQLLYGIQQKNFSYPDLYAAQELHDLVGSSGIEGDNLNSALVAFNHTENFCDTDQLDVTAYYRRNHDDYDFDHFNPPLFNAFRHTTKTYAAGASYKQETDWGTARYHAAVVGDELDSTSLVFGPYSSRVQGLGSATLSRSDPIAEASAINATIGMRGDSSNHNKDTLAPIAYLGLEQKYDTVTATLYTSYSQSSEVPGYTALSSNADSGLFRGNPNLSRTVSKSSEIGLELKDKAVVSKTDFFARRDNDLVDWVYDSTAPAYAARNARNLDLTTYGLEQTVTATMEPAILTGGYTYYDKNPDYDLGGGDSSFYALNYARQRIFAKAELELTENLKFLTKVEWRDQYPNTLRQKDTSQDYTLTSVGLRYANQKDWSVDLLVDNLGNENFEEVPGVPSSKRTAGVFGTIYW